jgi:hypothetical protein
METYAAEGTMDEDTQTKCKCNVGQGGRKKLGGRALIIESENRAEEAL